MFLGIVLDHISSGGRNSPGRQTTGESVYCIQRLEPYRAMPDVSSLLADNSRQSRSSSSGRQTEHCGSWGVS